MTHLYVLH
jgi:hypothetical protein